MKAPSILLTLTILSGSVFGGGPATVAVSNEPDAFKWLTPTIDIRTRYEFREIDGEDPSHALTSRVRAGLLLGEFGGFSAFGEIEATGVLIDDYRSNPTGDTSTDPYVAGNTPIGDPENLEVNRAWVQWQGHGAAVKAGRQRLKRRNDAFVGNVGWRQNEQTYDALSLNYVRDAFTLFCAYSNRAQRIFGDDANDAPPGPPLHDFEGDFHFLDASYDFGPVQAGAYAYLIDVNNNGPVGESNTFGAHLTSGPLNVEAAYQDGDTTLNGRGDYGAWYGHAMVSKQWGGATYGAGVEYLEDNFKTPFATVHAFNGFADAFILQRIGLNDNGGAYDGIADIYVSYVRPGLPLDITFKGFLHWFLDDGFGTSYGYEADAVLEKEFSDNFTGILKGALFFADRGSGYADITQLSVEANLRF